MQRWSRLALTTLVVLLAPLAAGGPAAGAASGVELRPVEDPAMGVSSVVPAGWRSMGSGIHVRGELPEDVTLLAIQSVPVGVEDVWPSLLPQLSLEERPESTGELEAAGFEWALYEVPVTAGGAITMTVELALAEDDGATHLLLLQATPEEFPVLREQVLVPAIQAFAVLAPEPTPDPATLGYDVEEVTFPGGSPSVELAGTLTVPKGGGPHPAVVLMSGSGAQDRDESLRPISTLKPFALIADALTSAGVAVLRYDDRGVGQSSGEYSTATIEELASDGAAALEFLRGREEIDPGRVGLLGHSEGGLYAAMLGAADPDIAFIVGLAAPAVDGVDLIVAQNVAITRASGAAEEEVALAAAFAQEAMPLARDGDTDGVEALLREHLGRLWDLTPEAERTVMGDREGFVESQVKSQLPGLISDWYRSILAYDPAPDWQLVRAPVLGIYGGRDVQVLADQNEEALRAALEAGGNQDVEIVVLPEANHLLQASETGALAEYATLPPEFTPELLPAIVAWVSGRTGLASGS